MIYVRWFGEHITAIRIQLCHCYTEMVMDWCPLEDALLFAFLLARLEVFHLQDDRKIFYQEDTTKNRD